MVSPSFLSFARFVEILICILFPSSFFSHAGSIKNSFHSTVSSSFLSAAISFDFFLCIFVSSSFLSSAGFVKNCSELWFPGVFILPLLCRICQKISLHCGVLILPLLCRIFKILLCIVVESYVLSSAEIFKLSSSSSTNNYGLGGASEDVPPSSSLLFFSIEKTRKTCCFNHLAIFILTPKIISPPELA